MCRLRLPTIFIATSLILVTSLAAQMHDHTMPMPGDGQFNPYVVADSAGGFYLSYVQRTSERNNVMLQRSTANGQFSMAVRVNDRVGDGAVRNENPPKVAIGPGNAVYVVWANERERWKGNIRFARSLNGGKTFERAIDLNSDISAPPISRAFQSIAVDAKGRIYVAWIDERDKTGKDRGAEIWLATSEDGGKTFSRDRKIISDVCECCRTAVVVDSAGRIYVSYRIVPSAGPMFRDIAIARSDDGGKSFKPYIVHHDAWELNACPIDGAAMTIDSDDRIHVVWFTQNGEIPRLYLASSTDHAASFSKPVVFDPGQKLAKHAHVVPLSGNQLLLSWDDTNSGSLVKWGVFNLSKQSLTLLGTQKQASYPIIAKSGNHIALIALQPERTDVLRIIKALE